MPCISRQPIQNSGIFTRMPNCGDSSISAALGDRAGTAYRVGIPGPGRATGSGRARDAPRGACSAGAGGGSGPRAGASLGARRRQDDPARTPLPSKNFNGEISRVEMTCGAHRSGDRILHVDRGVVRTMNGRIANQTIRMVAAKSPASAMVFTANSSRVVSLAGEERGELV